MLNLILRANFNNILVLKSSNTDELSILSPSEDKLSMKQYKHSTSNSSSNPVTNITSIVHTQDSKRYLTK